MNLSPSGSGPPLLPPHGGDVESCGHCKGIGYQDASVYYPRLGYSNRAFCYCPHGRAEFRAWKKLPEQRDYARRTRQRAVSRGLALSQLPPRFHQSTLGNLDRQPELRDALRDYLSRWPQHRRTGSGLFLVGRVGSGKTGAAAALASSLIRDRLVTVLFVSLPDLALQLEGKQGTREIKDLWDSMADIELLVLEDLDRVDPLSSTLRSRLYHLIDRRCRKHRPMLLSASCPLDELSPQLGLPTVSRIRRSCRPLRVPDLDQPPVPPNHRP